MKLVRQIVNDHDLATDDDPMPWMQPLRDLGAYALSTEGGNFFLCRDNVCLLPIIAGTLTESDVTFVPTSYRSMDFSLHPFQLEHILHLLHSKLDKQQLNLVLDNGQNREFQCMWLDFGMIPR